MNKKGVELSINMLVVIIIALVTLGLILGFIIKLFDRIEIPEFPQVTQEPTRESPIVLAPIEITGGNPEGMTIRFYNAGRTNLTTETVPTFTCLGIDSLAFSAGGLNIPAGSTNDYHVIVETPRNTPAGLYMCMVSIGATQKQFEITVK